MLVPANTFIATFEAILQAGGVPVPVDASFDDYNVDVNQLESSVSPRTRFILPVHLYGQLADMTGVAAVAEAHGLTVIEDACQSQGGVRDSRKAGSSSAGAAYSFYPAKNLGAFGDAGALVTSNGELAARVRELRDHGQSSKHHHDVSGYTARLDTIQAIVLLEKLGELEAHNQARSDAARHYCSRLAELSEVGLPPVPDGSRPVWHVFAIRTSRRDELQAFLNGRGIGTAVHYPRPPHLTPAFADLGYAKGSFPSCRATRRRASLAPNVPRESLRRSSMPCATPSGNSSVANEPANEAPYRLINDVDFGIDVTVQSFTNLVRLSNRRPHPGRAFRRDSTRCVDRHQVQDPKPRIHL